MIHRIKRLPVVVAVISLAAFAKGPATPNPSLEAARLNNLGAAYMNQQLFEKALKCFEDAATLDPKLEIVGVNQGIALLNLGRIAPARQLLEEAIKSSPNDPHVWYNLGLLYKNSDNPEAAVDAFRRVAGIDPNDPDAWYFLGATYAQSKQYPQALEAFQHAIQLNPLHASAQYGLARAYQQSGDAASAREHLVRFQYITQHKLGAAITLAYGEQGKYSLIEESPASPEKVPAEIKVRFVDVTSQAGLVTKSAPANSSDLASFLGPGACFLDYDNDGRVDIFLADSGKEGGTSLYRNLSSGQFEDVTRKAGLDPTLHGISCTAGDYDNDGAIDIAVSFARGLMLFHNENNGRFKDAPQVAGLRRDNFTVGLSFVDYDHDGDLDLFLTQYSDHICFDPRKPESHICNGVMVTHNSMLRNNGNQTFADVADSTGLQANHPTLGIVGTDYNNDRAVDFAVEYPDIPPVIFENPREGPFLPQTLFDGKMHAGSVAAAVLDINHDGWMDLAFTHWATPGLTLWRNREGKAFEPVNLPTTNWVHGWGVAAIDYDNDGWVDLVAVGETQDVRGEVRLFRNLGPDGFKDVTSDVGLDKIQLKDPRAIIVGDYDNDGAPDLLVTQNHGPAVLLRNEGGNQNHWLRLALTGLNDNKSAIGTKVEVFAGGVRQKFEIAGSSGYLGQNSPYLTVGLGQSKQADIVRMLWPSGVLQDEIEVAGDRLQKFTEIDRRGSSCPTLFVWDGKHYQLVGDMLGAGVVGHWVAPGQRNVPRPTEYIKIDRNAVREKDGRLSFRFMEPLEEAVYLDQVRLLAVDHPAEFDVYPNEYFASNPPYPPFKVVASNIQDAHPPAGAWDEHGHDVLPDLLAHRYFGDFEVLPFMGFAKPHSLELDLGEPYRGGPLWLLLHGEIEYFSATSMYAADQAGLQPISPYVEALGADGKWTRVIDDMGFPAGGARTMTADLSDKLPAGTHRIRVWTNLQIYWDSILISRTSQDQDIRLMPVPLARAELGFHGFPLKIEGQPPGNVQYIYEKASATGPYTRPAGAYTRYGDVLPLVDSFDDRLAVFGSGDEVALEFDPASLPPLASGWTRDYFFVANGYEKDMDFYAYDGNHVEPLPFRGMGTYPGKPYPLDGIHLHDLLQYNTRQMSGNEVPGYSFDYGPSK
jgi:Flp pilus assembly protein TadD